MLIPPVTLVLCSLLIPQSHQYCVVCLYHGHTMFVQSAYTPVTLVFNSLLIPSHTSIVQSAYTSVTFVILQAAYTPVTLVLCSLLIPQSHQYCSLLIPQLHQGYDHFGHKVFAATLATNSLLTKTKKSDRRLVKTIQRDLFSTTCDYAQPPGILVFCCFTVKPLTNPSTNRQLPYIDRFISVPNDHPYRFSNSPFGVKR